MRKIISSFVVFVFAFLTLATSFVSAKVMMEQTASVDVAKSEIVNDDLFIGAKNANLDGTVNGDVFIGAENVRVTGVVNGNLHIGSGTVNLGGRIRGNVYIGSGNVTISKSIIDGSLLIGGGSVSVDKETMIGGSLLSGAGQITIDSPVKRNVFVGSGSAQINSSVGGEVRVGAGSITLGPSTKIAKDFYYAIGDEDKEVSIAETATISGVTHKSLYNFATEKEFMSLKEKAPGMFRTFRVVTEIFSFLGALLIGSIYTKLFGKHLTTTSSFVVKSFWKTLGVGFLGTIVIVPAMILLAITGIGLPLAGLAFMLFLIYLYLTKFVVGIVLGGWVTGKFGWKKQSMFATMALGLLAIYLLKMVPVLGGITSLVILWSGLGALILNLFNQKAENRTI